MKTKKRKQQKKTNSTSIEAVASTTFVLVLELVPFALLAQLGFVVFVLEHVLLGLLVGFLALGHAAADLHRLVALVRRRLVLGHHALVGQLVVELVYAVDGQRRIAGAEDLRLQCVLCDYERLLHRSA